MAVNDESLLFACDADVDVKAYEALTAFSTYDAVVAKSATNACEALVEVCAYDAEILASAVVAYDAVIDRLSIVKPTPSVNSEPLICTNSW